MMRFLGLVVLFTAGAVSSFGGIITLVHSSTGSGWLDLNGDTSPDADEFFGLDALGGLAPVPFKIVASVEQNDSSPFSSGVWVPHLGATISIPFGVGGVYSFLTPTYTAVNPTTETVVFGTGADIDTDGLDLLQGPSDPIFAGWDFMSLVGPITGQGSLSQWDLTPIMTSVGQLQFFESTQDVTFEATPEPGSLILIALGLFGLGIVKRRFRQ